MLRVSGPPTTHSGAGNHYELVTLSALKTYLDRTAQGTGDDTLLQVLLDNVHRRVYSLTGNRILKSIGVAFVYYLDGRDDEALVLPQFPILAVTSVKQGWISESPNTFTSIRTVPTTEYYVSPDEGMLMSIPGAWAVGRHNYRVEWTAGYASIPADIKDAICMTVGVKLQDTKRGRWDKVNIAKEGEASAFVLDEFPPKARDVIRSYRRVELGIG